jgi:hypothetical protein
VPSLSNGRVSPVAKVSRSMIFAGIREGSGANAVAIICSIVFLRAKPTLLAAGKASSVEPSNKKV